MNQNLIQLQKQTNKLLSDFRLAKRSYKQEKLSLKESIRTQKAVIKAQNVLQHIAQQTEEIAHARISTIVTKCLEAVFNTDSYKFRFDFQRKRGKTEATPTLRRNGKILTDPLNSAGGGPCQVAGFALRVAYITLAEPQRRRLLICDEPFSALRSPAAERLEQMLIGLATELNFQFILIPSKDSMHELKKIGRVITIGGDKK